MNKLVSDWCWGGYWGCEYKHWTPPSYSSAPQPRVTRHQRRSCAMAGDPISRLEKDAVTQSCAVVAKLQGHVAPLLDTSFILDNC